MIAGSIVALITPMTATGDVDWPALEQLVEWHIAEGTDGIVAVGTTGESATLNVDEHLQVVKRVIEIVGQRVPVIAGTGANSTSEAIELTRAAKALGADACLLVTPYYNKPTQEGLYQHFKAVANAVAVPQILYNVPGRTACDMRNETVLRLLGVPHIIGIKDATGDVARGADLIKQAGASFAVYSGDDATGLDLMLAGAKGVISVSANVAPKLMAQLCKAALAGDAAGARALDTRLRPLHEQLYGEANPIPVKWALHAMGKIGLGIRLPLTVLSEPFRPIVREALRAVGIN